ncbi:MULTISPECIES: acyl-CoA thioesterase [Nocardia]|uniref:Acyl-CoA thioesterase n=1 Tax=Nocardia implantans TaxID=3108168 RepID=A0ABU6B091_9NOCA|nr:MULTISPECIES: acyl-CoA thioesterase [unclassified Nocardia]MBF6195184.1 acyl-CoA thioesterase [Nocardia beijingensis]MEA3530770.1 acyl-CoA thioesterase [Nocardia sp. CDC192]MEB3513100.1 acyl-CoA thioesterase [Nocardia sp. CDC186]
MSFSTRIEVRVSDLDSQLHVTGAAYHQYADHARFACVQAAGVSVEDLIASGLGPVNLETVLRFQRELRGGDVVDVSCAWQWGEGKTYRVEHVLTRADGVVAATVTTVSGLLDLTARRMVADPARHWAARASRPELLGLPGAAREATVVGA